MRHGITLPFEPFQGRLFPELVRAADRFGYTDAWSYESFSSDAFAPIAAAAMLSDKLRFGCAIIPVFTRPAPLIAMSAVTTNQLAGGRFILGLGISTPNIVEQWMGVPFRKPVTMMRETVEALRAIFRGEKVTMDGKMVKINGFRLDGPIEFAPKIYIGAQGTKMLRLAGELGDGVIVNFVTPETLPAMLDHTREGMRAAGKDPSKLDVVCRIMMALGEDASVARSMLKRALTAYVTVPQYNKFFQEIGYENEAGKAMELWNKGDRKQALESIPDTMVERIFVYGDAKTCRKRIDEYFTAGVTTTALQFISFSQNTEERRARVLKGMEDFANA